MKNLLLLLVSAFSIIANSQIVNIPDANFKARLIILGVDANYDGQISFSEAAIPISLDLSNKNISDLTGIEAFVNINILRCYSNNLTTLNLSNNTALTELYCSNNLLTNIDVSNNTSVTHINCSNNNLTSLNASNNTALIQLTCNHNLLTSLNVNNCIALAQFDCSYNLLSSIDVTDNTALTLFYCFNNHLTTLNTSSNTALISLKCDWNFITSLDVTNNTALGSLLCNNNLLTILDVSYNTALYKIDCSSNNLTSLNISNNTNLYILFCSSNQLTSLNLSENILLSEFACSGNQLTTLNLTNNVNLYFLYLSGPCGGLNLLSFLDLSQNILLQTIHIGKMPTLNEVCVWAMPFPPSTVALLDTADSPNVYFTDSCLTKITKKSIENDISNIFPNPSDNWINIQCVNGGNLNLQIINCIGQVMYLEQIRNTETEQINISSYPKGIYYLIIKTDDYIKTEKLIKD